MKTEGMRYWTFCGVNFGNDEKALLKSIDAGENVIVWKNNQKWVYKCVDSHHHRKGWKDSTQGHSSARAVEDDDFHNLGSQVKDCGWEFELSKRETKELENKGEVPPKMEQKLRDALNVWVIIIISEFM